MINADYAKVEARILDSMPVETRKLFEEARKEINAAPTKEARMLAKMKFHATLYGATPQDITNLVHSRTGRL